MRRPDNCRCRSRFCYWLKTPLPALAATIKVASAAGEDCRRAYRHLISGRRLSLPRSCIRRGADTPRRSGRTRLDLQAAAERLESDLVEARAERAEFIQPLTAWGRRNLGHRFLLAPARSRASLPDDDGPANIGRRWFRGRRGTILVTAGWPSRRKRLPAARRRVSSKCRG